MTVDRRRSCTASAESPARSTGARSRAISQYVLIFIAVTFTWLMGLMGYVRSGLRQHWHVYGVMRDTSVDAFTPTLGFATKVVSVTVLIFFALIGFVFWLASLHDKRRLGRAGGEALMTDPRAAPREARALVVGDRRRFYTYVGQLVPQKEVHPPKEIVIKEDMTTDRDGQGRQARSWRARASASPATRSASRRPLRFPDLDGIGARAKTREAGPSATSSTSPSRIYDPDAFIVPGFNPGMPVINKPPIGLTDQEILAVIAYLQSLGGKPTVTHGSRSSRPARTRLGRGGGEPRLPEVADPCSADPRASLVAVALVRRRPYALHLGRSRAGSAFYVALRFGFTVPIPASVVVDLHGHHDARAGRLRHLEPRARCAEFLGPLVALVNEQRCAAARWRSLVLLCRRSPRPASTCG